MASRDQGEIAELIASVRNILASRQASQEDLQSVVDALEAAHATGVLEQWGGDALKDLQAVRRETIEHAQSRGYQLVYADPDEDQEG